MNYSHVSWPLPDIAALITMIVPFTVAALALVPPPLQRPNVLMRRGDFLVGALLTPLLPPRPAWADEASKSAGAAVTDKVKLEFVEQVSAQESRTLAMTIGLFGKEAPDAVAAFRDACAGKLAVPCPSEVDLTLEVMERSKQSKKAALKACLGYEAEPVTYAYSQVWSIQRGRRIDAGAVQGKFAMRVPPVTPSTEAAALPHDAAGLLSVRRGGGIFDFGLTTGPTPEYDAEYAVIGRVLEGMESLAELDALPVVVRADSAPPNATRPAYACAARPSHDSCSLRMPCVRPSRRRRRCSTWRLRADRGKRHARTAHRTATARRTSRLGRSPSCAPRCYDAMG